MNEQIKNIKLLIFSVDGTVTPYNGRELWRMPVYFFQKIYDMEHKPFIALATNQSGVGLRYWMERDGFGNPDELPTENDVFQRMHLISSSIQRLTDIEKVKVYICFMHQSKSGNWSPMKENSFEWQKSNRKPAPGMLLQAMVDATILAEETLFIGGEPNDMIAAERAGCHFMTAQEFFYDSYDFDQMGVLYSGKRNE